MIEFHLTLFERVESFGVK